MPSKYRHCMYRLTVVTETILFTYQSIIIFCFYLTWPLPNVLAYEEYAFKPLNPAAKCKRSQRYPFVSGFEIIDTNLSKNMLNVFCFIFNLWCKYHHTMDFLDKWQDYLLIGFRKSLKSEYSCKQINFCLCQFLPCSGELSKLLRMNTHTMLTPHKNSITDILKICMAAPIVNRTALYNGFRDVQKNAQYKYILLFYFCAMPQKHLAHPR